MDVPADERCGSNQTNSLDIDVSAYKSLTAGMNGGVEWDAVSLRVRYVVCLLMRLPQSQPNLRINITMDVPCQE